MILLHPQGIHLINIVKMHIDQCQIQHLFLNQVGGTHGAVFGQNDRNIRIFSAKEKKQIRKKYSAEQRRDPDAKGRVLFSEIIKFGCGLAELCKQMICLLIKNLPFFCQGHMIF